MAALKLSAAEIATALAGLSEEERGELLLLLQQAAEERATAPVDTRVPIDRLVEQARQQAAAKSRDPERWLEMDAAHDAARSAHYQRLTAGQDMQADIGAWLNAAAEAWREARDLAIADGHPPPDLKKVPEPDGDDADDALASLPPATRRDVECSRARREDARIAELLRKAGGRDA